jgi:hypothetical protein
MPKHKLTLPGPNREWGSKKKLISLSCPTSGFVCVRNKSIFEEHSKGKFSESKTDAFQLNC